MWRYAKGPCFLPKPAQSCINLEQVGTISPTWFSWLRRSYLGNLRPVQFGALNCGKKLAYRRPKLLRDIAEQETVGSSLIDKVLALIHFGGIARGPIRVQSPRRPPRAALDPVAPGKVGWSRACWRTYSVRHRCPQWYSILSHFPANSSQGY